MECTQYFHSFIQKLRTKSFRKKTLIESYGKIAVLIRQFLEKKSEFEILGLKFSRLTRSTLFENKIQSK
jgi:hypothetical protein